MSTKNNGGPAFPLSESSSSVHNGMTMRQYYKAAALQGLLASPRVFTVDGNSGDLSETETARACGLFADAMLAEDKEHANET